MSVNTLRTDNLSIVLCACGNNASRKRPPKQSARGISETRASRVRWFADFPLGVNDGVPYIILKLLPKLAPEFWVMMKISLILSICSKINALQITPLPEELAGVHENTVNLTMHICESMGRVG
jgi:hypothetical protein